MPTVPALRMPVILIDNGHGKDTPGKRSPHAVMELIHSPLYFREYSWTRKCAQGIVDVLQAMGYTAFLLVKEEDDVALRERVNRVNAYCRRYGTDNVLLVSVHNNASGKGEAWMPARGWRAYTTKGVTKSDHLAARIYDAAEKTFRKPLKVGRYSSEEETGRDFEEGLYILQHTYCAAVLTENFFQDNAEDVLYLNSDEGLGACIDVHVQGIIDYINQKQR